MRHYTMWVAVMLVLVIGCSEPERVTAPPVERGVAELFNGNWTGTVTILKTGSCLVGGSDSTGGDVTMTWHVNQQGDITIDESFFPCTWSGTINSKDWSVTLTKIVIWSKDSTMSEDACNESEVVDTIQFTGTIYEKVGGGKFWLDIKAEENWCPDWGCTYLVKYHIEK